MKIKTRCNNCGKIYQMSADFIGKTAQCKQCRNNFVMSAYEEPLDNAPTLELQLTDPTPPPQPVAPQPSAASARPAASQPGVANMRAQTGGQSPVPGSPGLQAPPSPARPQNSPLGGLGLQSPGFGGAAAGQGLAGAGNMPLSATGPGFQGQALANPALGGLQVQPAPPLPSAAPPLSPAYGAPMQQRPPYAPPCRTWPSTNRFRLWVLAAPLRPNPALIPRRLSVPNAVIPQIFPKSAVK